MSLTPGDARSVTARHVPVLALILAVAVALRLLALPASTERNMDADSAHLMNVARCFERGQGFSNPAAWPAWMKPERLPMPETFKEPAYPFAVAKLAPAVGGEFRAGILIALLAGLTLPVSTWALARNLGLDPRVAALSGLLVAANPLSVFMSVRVMVDSLFPALLTAAFALAAWNPTGRRRPMWTDVATGVAVGLAFMTRAQTLTALPALALFMARRPKGRALSGSLIAVAAAIVTASPFLIRNLREFGAPFHSDVAAFGLMPYIDYVTLSTGLERPPAPLAFALQHLPQVMWHVAESAVRFAAYALPNEILGHPLWTVPFAAGLLLSLRRSREFLPVWTYLAMTLGLVFAVNWDARYFSSTVPFWAVLTAVGGMWIARALDRVELVGPLRGRHLLAAAVLVTFAVQALSVRRELARTRPPEIEAAMAEAPFLQSRLRPDEAVMAVTTSFYSWFADRPSVYLVIADEERFMEIVRRLKVRYAALPTSRLGEFASRFPEHRLPRALVVDHVNPRSDVTMFVIEAAAQVSPAE